MQEILKIIEELKSLSGNAQLNKLSEYKTNDLLKEVLIYTYDTSKIYKLVMPKLIRLWRLIRGSINYHRYFHTKT